MANTHLSPGGVLEINGRSMIVEDYQAMVKRYLAGTMLPSDWMPELKINPPTAVEKASGVQQLVSLNLSFDPFAIVTGGLLPTNPGCPKDNWPGKFNEYRNGALLVQALDASDVFGGFSYDSSTGIWEAGSTSVNDEFGHATSGILWEAAMYWHWKGSCYGSDKWDEELMDANCRSPEGVRLGWFNTPGACLSDDDDDDDDDKGKSGKKKKDKDNPVPEPPKGPPPKPLDPDHDVTNTTVERTRDLGRLFWRELFPTG